MTETFWNNTSSGNYYWTLSNGYIITRNLMTTYNPETHELVEKKEAKIKRLNDELQRWKDDVEILDEEILSRSKEKSETKVLINKITEELRTLE